MSVEEEADQFNSEESEEDLAGYFDDDDESDDAEPAVVTPAPRRSDNSAGQVAQLQAEVDRLTAENKDLNTRLGNALRTNGEKLRAKDEEIAEWLQKTREWCESELQDAHRDGYNEGVAEVEQRLLPLLEAKDKATYLEAMRTTQVKPSQRPIPAFETRRKASSQDTDDVSELVQEFKALGVPVDQIDQTSAAAVVASAGNYLKAQVSRSADSNPAPEPPAPEEPRPERQVSSGVGGVTNGGHRLSKDLARLEELNAQIKKLRGNGAPRIAMPLVQERDEIKARIEAAQRRRSVA